MSTATATAAVLVCSCGSKVEVIRRQAVEEVLVRFL